MSDQLPAPAASNTFERIKRVNESGAEFWSARELARVLEYREFRNLSAAIAKAREACAQSGHAVSDHFVLFNEMVGIGSGAQRELEDWALSRYACYLVIQNADPSKPLVALGQTYFAIQTRRQELADAEALQESQKRLTALFCSARCPGKLILRTYDQVAQWRDAGHCVVSGFHSPVEKECLRILLRGEPPIIICPARASIEHRTSNIQRPAALPGG